VTTIVCTFVPQYWGGPKYDYVYPADPEGDTVWEMPMTEVTQLTSVSNMQHMDNDPYARDDLRHSKNAPQWVKNWSGPFEIEWEVK